MKFRTPILLFSLLTLSSRKCSLLILPDTSNLFIFKSPILWNTIATKLGFSGYEDFATKAVTIKNLIKKYLLLKQSSQDEQIWSKENYELL